MDDTCETAIAAVCYTAVPDLDLGAIVTALERALERCPHAARRVLWDCNDVAMIDLDGSRLLVGWDDRLPGRYRGCLSVAVGRGPGGGAQPLAGLEAAVCAAIVARVTRRYPADAVRHARDAAPPTPERLDALTEALAEGPGTAGTGAGWAGGAGIAAEVDRLLARCAAEARGAAAQPMPDGAAPGAAAPPQDGAPPAPRLPHTAPARTATARSTGERARRRARHASVQAAAMAADTPMPAVDIARIRAALHDDDTLPAAATPVQRLAVGAMGCTLLLVAAPVGGAVLTYNTFRGASLPATARAMALTGAAMALFGDRGLGALLAIA